jgi:hypothetical protein
MFSLLNRAGSNSNSPDMGKENGSVEKVFDIYDHKVPIDAILDDNNVEKIRLNFSKIKR